jgi:hypothetical protein
VARLPLDGGPLEGLAAPRVSGRYAWINRRGQATSNPTNGRALYERSGDRYIYAGHRIAFCNLCRAYHRRAEGGSETLPCPITEAQGATA